MPVGCTDEAKAMRLSVVAKLEVGVATIEKHLGVDPMPMWVSVGLAVAARVWEWVGCVCISANLNCPPLGGRRSVGDFCPAGVP